MSRTLPGLSLFSLGVCIAAGGPLVAHAAKPTEHTSDAGRYRATFPDRPTVTTKDLSTGKQVVRVVTERANGPHGLVFAVTYTDYPDSFRDVKAELILGGAVDGLRGKDGEQTQEPLDPPDGVRAARTVRVSAGRNAVRADLYLVGTRLYQVMVTGPSASIRDESVGEFLGSFKIVR